MAYNTNLIYVTDADELSRLLPVVRHVAQKGAPKGTHVIGYHVMRSVQVYPGISLPAEAGVFSNLAKRYAENADACREKFLAETDRDDFIAEWRQTEAGHRTSEDVATEQARIADLIICSQPGVGAGFYPSIVAEQFILESGRPVLLVPASGDVASLGHRPLVAWNGSKEACRALFDAIPLLRGSELTTLLELASDSAKGSGIELPAAEMCRTLERHGVRCDVARVTVDGAAFGEEVLSQIADRNCDLLVMGGYGHSRMRQFVLGGVTRYILRHMTVPVLLSH